MKKHTTTLKTFIKDFPKESFHTQTYVDPNKISLDRLSHMEKAKLQGHVLSNNTTLKITENTLYFGESQVILIRKGKSFFPKSFVIQYIYIIDNKIKLIRPTNSFIKTFLELCNITWWRDLTDMTIRYFTKPSILKSILLGTIYNEETLYKAIATRIYGIKNISWKTVRDYVISVEGRFSLTDLYYYTKNVDETVKALVAVAFKWSINRKESLYTDMLQYAIKLNQTIDFTWSEKRMAAEHAKQIETWNLQEISAKETKPIYKECLGTNTIKQLNTELEIYKEGTIMHHCLYTCYYSRIKDHRYMAFHMTAPEDCTFSVRKEGDGILFDQIYLKYDQPVTSATRAIAERFVSENTDKIREMLDGKNNDAVDLDWHI